MKTKRLFSLGLALLSAFVLLYLFNFYDGLVCAQPWYTDQKVWDIFCNTKLLLLSLPNALLFLAAFVFLCFFLQNKERTSDFLFRYRYPLALVVLAICVLLRLNGSSIGCWGELMEGADRYQGISFGISRTIRSDEWAVSTPMALSQYLDPVQPFSYYSHLLRGAATDVFLEYGQPVRNLAALFRPFHWGYLFLTQGMGLAFYWCGRSIALFLASFEMGRILTKDNRPFSLVYACMILFAPIVQWWYATNGLMEMLIYMQYSVVLLYAYMRETHTARKLLALSGICICAGGYILTMYPAWQVPLAYLVLALAIYMLIREWKNAVFTKKQIVFSVFCILFFVGLLVYVLWMSRETIRTILQTAYPGDRFDVGGNGTSHLFRYLSSIWLPIKDTDLLENACECAFVIDLYPLCYVFSIPALFRKKDRDLLTCILLAVCIFLDFWIILGFPKFLAKITLMSFATTGRVVQVAGFAHLMLLFRSVSCSRIRLKAPVAGILAVALAVLLSRYQPITKPFYFETAPELLPITAVIFSILFFLFLHDRKDRFHTLLCGFTVLVMLMSGLLVNPIRHGTVVLRENPLYTAIQEVKQKDPTALWASSDSPWSLGNFCAMSGAPTINSTNVYPLLERWHTLDPDGAEEEIYNRYAHILLYVQDEGEPKFELNSLDSFQVTLTLDDLKALNVTYLLARKDLKESLPESGDRLTLEAQAVSYYIYRID